MVARSCAETKADGRLCRANALRDQPFCFWHSAETADELADARRTGGLHRRKKRTVATVYGFSGLRTIEDHQDLLETITIETITIETLALENSLARNGTLNRMLQTGAKLLEFGDLTTRLGAIEAVLVGQKRRPDEELG
jgi:hypothetical protein